MSINITDEMEIKTRNRRRNKAYNRSGRAFVWIALKAVSELQRDPWSNRRLPLLSFLKGAGGRHERNQKPGKPRKPNW